MTEAKGEARSLPAGFVIRSNHTDVLPNGFQFTMDFDVGGKVTSIREVTLEIFDLLIDISLVLEGGRTTAMVHAYKTRSVNSDGTVGREGFGVVLSGKRRLAEQRIFLAAKQATVSTAEEVMKLVNAEFKAKIGQSSQSHIVAQQVVPMISIEERDSEVEGDRDR